MYICLNNSTLGFFAAYDNVNTGLADVLLIHSDYKIVDISYADDIWKIVLLHPTMGKEEYIIRPTKIYHAEDIKRP